jgi:hypothetical protein
MKHKFDWTTVPMPENIAKFCRKDPRGLPVPFVVLQDANGVYHFKVNDSQKTGMAIIGRKCSICGQPMQKGDRWLVGGISSAFDPNGAYIDIPVHKECGVYALQVCPYLAVRNYNYKTDLNKLATKIQLIEGTSVKLQDTTIDTDRLPLFVLCKPKSYEYIIGPDNNFFLVPTRPFLEQEFWDEGRLLTTEEALNKIKGTKWEKYGNSFQI